VALLGDAAWCVTPLGGIGATLSVTGAYVLAGEIALHPDPAAAFAAYETAMRPMVEQGQSIPKFDPRLAHPRSRVGIAVLHGALRILTRPGLGKLAGRFLTPARKEPDLSRYPRLGLD
jgi:2-polyprenyl-6-methoxyphenol hydroxylase-like FAD-dependent oxidoreductase